MAAMNVTRRTAGESVDQPAPMRAAVARERDNIMP
jgi:hypothetical protein